MSLLIVAVLAYGFSRTVNEKLIHPSVPPPLILYLHAATAVGWVVLFVTQAALVQSRNIRLHRRLGWVALLNGILISTVGVPTALAMARFNVLHALSSPDQAAAFLIVSFSDLTAFSVILVLAISWHRDPEYHRRLMLMASCYLTGAAFARFPFNTIEGYGGIDVLILLGVGRDLLMSKKVHPVYVFGLPLLIIGQVVTMTVYLNRVPVWMTIARRLID